MNLTEFNEKTVSYYGSPKRESIQITLLTYIKEKTNLEKLDDLYSALIETHSAQATNFPYPSVKEIVDAMNHARKSGKDLTPPSKLNVEVKRIEKHKAEVEALPDSERIEFENEGDLFRQIIGNRETAGGEK